MNICRFLLLGSLLSIGSSVNAQTACPPGMTPYGAGVCGYDNSQPQESPQPQAPRSPPQIWVDHYGAISTDPIKSILGTAVNQPSPRQAEQAAFANCQAKGGTACKQDIEYGNQCVAMVVGKTGYNTKAGATIDDAVQAAMKVCSAATSNCHAYYTACSLPMRIQ